MALILGSQAMRSSKANLVFYNGVVKEILKGQENEWRSLESMCNMNAFN